MGFSQSVANAQPCIPYPDCLFLTPGAFETHQAEVDQTLTAQPTVRSSSTPSYNPLVTSTPSPTMVGDTGCPNFEPDYNDLDPKYIKECSRCFNLPTPTPGRIATKIIPTAKIQSPDSTAEVTSEPTDEVPGGGGATATAAPTNTPAPTLDPWVTVSFDLTLDDYDIEIHPHACTGNPAGHWVLGQGIKPDFGGCGGGVWAYQITWTMNDLMPSTVRNFTLHGSFGDTNYFTLSGDPAVGPYIPADFDSTLLRIRRWDDERDYRSWSITDVTEGVVLESVSFEYNAGFSPTLTPSPSPSPTSTWEWVGQRPNCTVPVYRNDNPAVGFDGLDEFRYDCYILLPPFTLSLPSNQGVPGANDLGWQGVELCVHWIVFPSITILGWVFEPNLIFGLVMVGAILRNYIMHL